MLAARARQLTLTVHAVEGGGVAVCGARADGRWRLSSRLPITCPTCLLRLGSPRLAVCGTPSPRLREPLHLRVLSRQGFSPRGGPDTVTVCGRPAGWDVRLVGGRVVVPREGESLCRRCLHGAAAALDASNGVR